LRKLGAAAAAAAARCEDQQADCSVWCVRWAAHALGGCVGLWIASKALYAAWDKRIEVAGRECARALLKHSFKAPHVHRIRIMCSSSRDAASRTASRTVENAYDGNHVFG
jgi:hypothetical protein